MDPHFTSAVATAAPVADDDVAAADGAAGRAGKGFTAPGGGVANFFARTIPCAATLVAWTEKRNQFLGLTM